MITRVWAAAAGVAAWCVPAIAMAGADFVDIVNEGSAAQVIEFAFVKSGPCHNPRARAGRETIPPGGVHTLRSKGESFVCIRSPGQHWFKEDLRNKNARVKLRVNDPGR
jgi:hypothetical protein